MVDAINIEYVIILTHNKLYLNVGNVLSNKKRNNAIIPIKHRIINPSSMQIINLYNFQWGRFIVGTYYLFTKIFYLLIFKMFYRFYNY